VCKICSIVVLRLVSVFCKETPTKTRKLSSDGLPKTVIERKSFFKTSKYTYKEISSFSPITSSISFLHFFWYSGLFAKLYSVIDRPNERRNVNIFQNTVRWFEVILIVNVRTQIKSNPCVCIHFLKYQESNKNFFIKLFWSIPSLRMTDPPLITDNGSAADHGWRIRRCNDFSWPRLRLPLHSECDLATCSKPQGCIWKAERSRFRTPL